MPWQSDVIQHAFTFERAVVNPYNLTTVLLPLHISYFVMAILVQFPHTGFYRVALLPIVFWFSYRSAVSLDFSWNSPRYAHLNHVMAVYCCDVKDKPELHGLTAVPQATLFSHSMRCATWAFAERPYSRLPIFKPGNGTTSDGDDRKDTSTNYASIFSKMWDAWELLGNPRGIGWDGPPKMPIPTPYFQVESRILFGLLSFCQFVFLATAFDIFLRSIQVLGAQSFGRPEGGTIFDSSLPPFQRYLKSSIVTLLVGFAMYSLIDAIYHLGAALSTVLFRHQTSYWPPIFDSPWFATSVGSFWGRRWHQLCRELFVGVGSKPLERYFGRVGTIMGAFFISGVMHDVAVRGMYQTTDSLSVTGFFLVQGVGVVLEYAWRKVTGRRVGGFVGWLWALFWLVSWGNVVVDAWARSGLLGAKFGPDEWRPSVLFLNWMSRNEFLT